MASGTVPSGKASNHPSKVTTHGISKRSMSRISAMLSQFSCRRIRSLSVRLGFPEGATCLQHFVSFKLHCENLFLGVCQRSESGVGRDVRLDPLQILFYRSVGYDFGLLSWRLVLARPDLRKEQFNIQLPERTPFSRINSLTEPKKLENASDARKLGFQRTCRCFT